MAGGVEIRECGHVASSADDDLAKRVELEPTCCRRAQAVRPPSPRHPVHDTTGSVFRRSSCPIRSRRCRRRAPRGERIFETQLVDRRPVLRGQIHHPLGGIRGVRAPIRSAAGAGERDRFFESRRSEQPFVAHLRDALSSTQPALRRSG